jgi:hypothetical protein
MKKKISSQKRYKVKYPISIDINGTDRKCNHGIDNKNKWTIKRWNDREKRTKIKLLTISRKSIYTLYNKKQTRMIHFLYIMCLLTICILIWMVMAYGFQGQYLCIIRNEYIAQTGVIILFLLFTIDWLIIVVWSLVIVSGFISPTWAMITNFMHSLW